VSKTGGWKEFFQRLYAKVDTTDVFNRAALVAFYFSLAFFPLLLFLVSLAGLILSSTDDLKHDLYGYLFQIMPFNAYELVQRTLEEIIENSSGGKLTIGLFITLWSASAGVDSLRGSLNAVYELRECRRWWVIKVQSILLTFLFIVLLVLALITVSAGLQGFELILRTAGFELNSPALLLVVQWASLLLLLVFTTEIIYNWLPCHQEFIWRWITPGSVVAIGLWISLTVSFRIYLQYFNTYNRAYGSLGAVIILMLWMFLTATAILLGGAINSVLKEMTGAGRKPSPAEHQPKPPLNPS
jgi:membrane protein